MGTTMKRGMLFAAFGAALMLALACAFAAPAHAATTQTYTQTQLGYQAFPVKLEKGAFKLESQAGASWSSVGIYAQIDSEGKGVGTGQMAFNYMGDPYQKKVDYGNVAKTGTYYVVFNAYKPISESSQGGAIGTTAKITSYKFGAPTSLTLKKSAVSTSCGDNSTIAYYKLKVTKRGKLSITATDATDNTYPYSVSMRLCNAKKKPFTSYDAWAYVKSGESANFGVKKGTYFLAVKSSASVYKIVPKLTSVTKEGGAKKSKAVAIAKGKVMKGVLAAGEKARWYKFKVTKAKKYTFSINGKPDDAGLKLTFSGDGYYNATARISDYTPKTTLKTEKLKKGTYYIKVEPGASSGKGGNGYFTIKWK